jgi:hypothetical protein
VYPSVAMIYICMDPLCIFLVAMIATYIYYMDSLCTFFMAMDISYDFITHGYKVYLILVAMLIPLLSMLL